MIRPSGFYRNKSKGIYEFFNWYENYEDDPRLVNTAFSETKELRNVLLKLHGIGEETADCLLLYVFDRVVFVSDAYARRFFGRLNGEDYPNYKRLHHKIDLEKEGFTLEEFHGLIDEFGKMYLSGRIDKWDESFMNPYH